jgi:hypothetical protein
MTLQVFGVEHNPDGTLTGRMEVPNIATLKIDKDDDKDDDKKEGRVKAGSVASSEIYWPTQKEMVEAYVVIRNAKSALPHLST